MTGHSSERAQATLDFANLSELSEISCSIGISTELPLPLSLELYVSWYEGMIDDYPPPPSLVNVIEARRIIPF